MPNQVGAWNTALTIVNVEFFATNVGIIQTQFFGIASFIKTSR
jgi:hypothetical protein